MGLPVDDIPAPETERIRILLLRFGLVAAAVIGWKGASHLWEAGNTVSNTSSLILMLVTGLTCFVLLVLAALRRPPDTAVLAIPVMMLLVFLAFSQTHSVHQFTNGTLVTTDVLVYEDYAARLILEGENPYLHDLRPGHEVFRANLEYSTPLLDADYASRLVYPALAPLLFVPFQVLGLSTQAVFPLFFLLATAVLFWATPVDFRPVVLLPFFAEQRYLQYAFGGVSDIVWAFLLLLVIVTWKRPVQRGLWFGLACAYKQHPWLLAPFLVIRIWRETDGTKTEKARQVLLFVGVSSGVFFAVNAPFMLSDPKIWLGSIFQPLTTPMIAFGQGLTSLGVTGLLVLPKPALTVLMLAALCTLLFVYSRHFCQLRPLMWIAPGIAMWLGNRSLSSYWYFFALPLLLEVVRHRRMSAPAEDPPGKNHIWPTAAVVGAFAVLLVSVLLWGGLQEPALEVSVRPPLRTDGEWVHQMTVEVLNRSDTPVQARVAVQSWTNQPFFWIIDRGPEVLLPQQRGVFVVRADAPFQRFLIRRGARVTVSDATRSHLRGMARVHPDPTRAYPTVIDNGGFEFWDADGSKPIGWQPDVLPLGRGAVEFTRIDDERDGLRLSIPQTDGDDYSRVRLKTTVLFPEDPILITVYVPREANTSPDRDLLYGLELGCFGETVTVVFGEEEGRLESGDGLLLWGISAPRDEWTEIEVDPWEVFEGMGIITTPIRSRDRVVKLIDYPTAPLSLSLFLAARNQGGDVSGLFGPIRSRRLRPDRERIFHRTMASPERWLLWKGDRSFQFRNYEDAAENFQRAAELSELAPVANGRMEESLSRANFRKAVFEQERRFQAPREYSNVLLIVVDTLRADHLSVYGGDVDTPNIDHLASSGVLFERAYSHIPITGPSHASLFTAMLPPEHGVRNNAQFLRSRYPTIAETLLDAGFETSAFISLGVLQGKFGFSRGFVRYEDTFARDWMRNAEEVNSLVLPFLEGWDGSPYFLWVHYSDPHEPYSPPGLSYSRVRLMQGEKQIGSLVADGRGSSVAILLQPGPNLIRLEAVGPKPDRGFHFPRFTVGADGFELKLLDGWQRRRNGSGPASFGASLPASVVVTNPHERPETAIILLAAKERLSLEQIRMRYQKEVEYVDAQVGVLMASLARKGMLENTLIVFTSDHGEGLGDHDHVGHISQLYEPAIRVPLLMSYPGRIGSGTTVSQAVGLIDVFPTISELVGLPVPRNINGRSLVPQLEGDETPRAALAMTYRPEAPADKHAVLLDNFKFIRSDSDDDDVELYDLDQDPFETVDLRSDRPDLVRALGRELASRLAELIRGDEVESEEVRLSESEKEQLRALGYIH